MSLKSSFWGSSVKTLSASSRNPGFSLVEAVVIVAIVGIVAAIAVPSFFFVLRRERVNAVALELAGWLEQVRSASSEMVASSSSDGGCSITISGPSASASAGYELAKSDCNRWSNVAKVPADIGSTFRIGHSVPRALTANPPDADTCGSGFLCVGSATLVFSPRGMWSIDATGDLDEDIEIRVALSDGQGPKRCVRLSSILGAIDIGSSSDGDVSATCSSWGGI